MHRDRPVFNGTPYGIAQQGCAKQSCQHVVKRREAFRAADGPWTHRYVERTGNIWISARPNDENCSLQGPAIRWVPLNKPIEGISNRMAGQLLIFCGRNLADTNRGGFFTADRQAGRPAHQQCSSARGVIARGQNRSTRSSVPENTIECGLCCAQDYVR